MAHYVYIIYSASHDVYYKGYSQNPKERLQEHNDGRSKYTRGRGPWTLMFVEKFEHKVAALKREKQLKRQHRKYLEWLIVQPINMLEEYNMVG